jgi:hypothetical protein
LAGTTTALVAARWLSPILIALSVLLLGRSFYALYVQQQGTRTSKVITWLSAATVVGFWMGRGIQVIWERF